MRGLVGRADLLELLGELEPGAAAEKRAAALLGFEPVLENDGIPEDSIVEGPTGEVRRGAASIVVQAPVIAAAKTPFWRIEEYQPSDDGEHRRRERLVRARPYEASDSAPRETCPRQSPPLMPESQLGSALRRLLVEAVATADLDVEEAVSRIGRGEEVGFPKRARRRSVRHVALLIDRDPRLIPFWGDQEDLVHRLRRELGRDAVECWALPHGVGGPMVRIDAETDAERERAPCERIVALSDLGTYASDSRAQRSAWRRFGAKLRRDGHRLRGLVPGPASNWPVDGFGAWQVAAWGRAGGSPGAGQREKMVRRLLGALAPAVRIEPGLLREVRHALGMTDASLEIACWQHDWVIGVSSVAVGFDTGHLAAVEARFGAAVREEPAVIRQAIAILRAWHASERGEIETDETVRIDELSAGLVSAGERERAVSFHESIAARLTGASGDQPLAKWVRRMRTRAVGAMFGHDVYGPALRASYAAVRDPDDSLPRGMKASDLTPEAGPAKSCVLAQRGAELILDESSVHSPLGSVRAVGSRLLVAVGDGEARPLGQATRLPDLDAIEMPPWAVDAGRDEFGRWADLLVGDTRQRMRWIPPGEFLMGSPADEVGRQDEEREHEAVIPHGFWLGESPVTQALWTSVVGSNPSEFIGDDRPVESVSWDDVTRVFMTSITTRLDASNPRLPSEAEWEYACRARTRTANYRGGPETLDEIAWHRANSSATQPVKRKEPNGFGLYDMLGNVYEWCSDLEGGRGNTRVIRGGSWRTIETECRAASQGTGHPGVRYPYLGFRLALADDEPRPPRSDRDRVSEVSRVSDRRRSIRIETDFGVWRAKAIERPSWAVAAGRDRYGLWAEFEIRSLRHRLRWIPPGEFVMGSPPDEAGRFERERQHEVVITRGYWLGATTVTQALWEAVVGSNPSEFVSPDRPVERVSWNDVRGRFLEGVEQLLPGFEPRMPTEAEWEWACRANTMTSTYAGEMEIVGIRNAPALHPIAWYGGNSGVEFDLPTGHDSTAWRETQFDRARAGTRRVAGRQPNAFGLYDMLGNVFEWCHDWEGEHPASRESDPYGPSEGVFRVFRGGSWDSDARVCRAAYRRWGHPGGRGSILGFRLAGGQRAPSKSASELASDFGEGRTDDDAGRAVPSGE